MTEQPANSAETCDSRFEIAITNEQTCLEVNEAFLQEVAARVLSEEQVAAATLSIALVDNARIHELNRQYLQHDYETDVLSFLLDCDQVDGAPLPSLRGSGKRISGEVIISAEMSVQMSAEYDWSPEAELILYLVHGVLHLLGYDDLTPEEKTVMREKEQALLRHWNLIPQYTDTDSA